jgi:hypothetical protein
MASTEEEGTGSGLKIEDNPDQAGVERKSDNEKSTYKSYK